MCAFHILKSEVSIDPLAFPDFPESAIQVTRGRFLSQAVEAQDRASLIKFANKLKNGLLTFFYGKIGAKFQTPTSQFSD
jgi:hypothetical protein